MRRVAAAAANVVFGGYRIIVAAAIVPCSRNVFSGGPRVWVEDVLSIFEEETAESRVDTKHSRARARGRLLVEWPPQ